MHELAIAEAIMAVASKHADGRPIARVEVKIGQLRQVVLSALEFAFALIAPGVELELREVPAAGRCRACDRESRLDGFPLVCPACGSAAVDIVAGEELQVESLDVETEVAYDA